MAKDIAEKRSRRRQDPLKGPMGTIELRVATIQPGGNEDVVMRILAASKPLPLERWASRSGTWRVKASGEALRIAW